MKKTIYGLLVVMFTKNAIADVAPYYEKNSRLGNRVMQLNLTETSYGTCILDMISITYDTYNKVFEYMEKSECTSNDACARVQRPDSLSEAKSWHKLDGMDCAYETDDKTSYYVGELRYDESTFKCYLRYTIYNIRTDSNETSSSCKMHRKFLENNCYEDYSNCKTITKEEFDRLSAPQLKD